jgi:hypothetical protein
MSKAIPNADDLRHTKAVERQHREAALDDTIEASFPASDPPSSDPNPDAHESPNDVAPADERIVSRSKSTSPN